MKSVVLVYDLRVGGCEEREEDWEDGKNGTGDDDKPGLRLHSAWADEGQALVFMSQVRAESRRCWKCRIAPVFENGQEQVDYRRAEARRSGYAKLTEEEREALGLGPS